MMHTQAYIAINAREAVTSFGGGGADQYAVLGSAAMQVLSKPKSHLGT